MKQDNVDPIVETWLGRIQEQFVRDRSIFARGRQSELDGALGKRPRYLSRLLDRSIGRLRVDYLNQALLFLGFTPLEFVTSALPGATVPKRPRRGFVLERLRKGKLSADGHGRNSLAEVVSWLECIEVTEKASPLSVDIEAVLRSCQPGTAAFETLGWAALVSLSSGSAPDEIVEVAPQESRSILNLLQTCAKSSARVGDRLTAATLVEAGFELEEKGPHDLELRAKLLSLASSLLRDEFVFDAAWLNRSALVLYLIAGDAASAAEELREQARLAMNLDSSAVMASQLDRAAAQLVSNSGDSEESFGNWNRDSVNCLRVWPAENLAALLNEEVHLADGLMMRDIDGVLGRPSALAEFRSGRHLGQFRLERLLKVATIVDCDPVELYSRASGVLRFPLPATGILPSILASSGAISTSEASGNELPDLDLLREFKVRTREKAGNSPETFQIGSNYFSRSALDAAQGFLEEILAGPKELTGRQARSICKALFLVARDRRLRGRLRESVAILDIACSIEERLPAFDIRSQLLRSCFYLAMNLGYLPTAEILAWRAFEGAVVIGDQTAISDGLYTYALALDLRGEYKTAVSIYKGTLALNPAGTGPFKVATMHAIAYCQMHLGELEAANDSLNSAEGAGGAIDEATLARILALRGNIRSREGRVSEADGFFDRAESLMWQEDNLDDSVLFALDKTLHYLRSGRLSLARVYAQKILGIATRFQGNRNVSAAILNLSRLAFRDELNVQAVETVRLLLEKPWLKRGEVGISH